MQPCEVTYHSIDKSKPDLGPFAVTATDPNHATDLAIEIIKRDYSWINLQNDYETFPDVSWPNPH